MSETRRGEARNGDRLGSASVPRSMLRDPSFRAAAAADRPRTTALARTTSPTRPPIGGALARARTDTLAISARARQPGDTPPTAPARATVRSSQKLSAAPPTSSMASSIVPRDRQLDRALEKAPLLEPERVGGAEVRRIDRRLGEVEVASTRSASSTYCLRLARPKLSSRRHDARLAASFVGARWDERDGIGGLPTVEVVPELVHEHVPDRARPDLADRVLIRERQAEPGLDELADFVQGSLLNDRCVVLVAGDPFQQGDSLDRLPSIAFRIDGPGPDSAWSR